MQDSFPSRRRKIVSLRLAPEVYAELVEVAKEAGLPLAAAARALLEHALARHRAGDAEVQRAIRVSRDG